MYQCCNIYGENMKYFVLFFAVIRGRDTEILFKYGREICLVAEANIEGDLRDDGSISYETLGLFHPQVAYKLAGTYSSALLNLSV